MQHADYNSFGGHDHDELQVLRSAAGYYVGSLYEETDGLFLPYDRASDGYWATRAEAERYLAVLLGE